MSKKDDKLTTGKDDSVVIPKPEPSDRSFADASADPTPPLVAVYRDEQEVSSSAAADNVDAEAGRKATNGAEAHLSRPPHAQSRAKSGEREANFFERTGQFFSDVRTEMKRVSWPTATEVKNTTIITLIAVMFFAFYLFIIDKGIAFFITQLERFVEWLL